MFLLPILTMLCLQAVPVAQVHSYSQLYPQQTVFALNEAAGRLYAAGGAAPSTVHTWEMSQERCTQQVGSSALFIHAIVSPSFLANFCSFNHANAPSIMINLPESELCAHCD